jgi:cellulose synthase/poly-beta-1,6-N-acetylglucosamine synthase-like glycosyltransferase
VKNIKGIIVSVVVPIRNEEPYIRVCLTSLLQQTYPKEQYEVIVLDGRSSDRSMEIVEELCCHHPNLRCLDNPAAIVPAAMNAGIRNSAGEIIIRADGHTVYPSDYLENCVKYLEDTGADNVGGPVLTVPTDSTFAARLVAAVLSNPFGVGNSRFRTTAVEGYVDTVPFGAFRRELFDRIGLYNEKLVRNQDVDLNARIKKAGGKIYQTPALKTQYHPVGRFRQLLKQTFRESRWHVVTLRENVRSLRPRHMAPAVFAFFLITLLPISFVSNLGLIMLACILVAHLIAGACAAGQSREYGPVVVWALPCACFCFHLAYGLGTIAGLLYLFKSPSAAPIRAGQPVH